MRRLVEACERIAGTTKKLLKTGIVAEYLRSRTVEEASLSAVFLSGRPFAAWEEITLQVGGRLLWRIVAELGGKEEGELTASYRRHGDLGAVAVRGAALDAAGTCDGAAGAGAATAAGGDGDTDSVSPGTAASSRRR